MEREEAEKRVSEIKSEIKNLETELQSIQDGCSHKSQETKFDHENRVRKFCAECKKPLAYATEQEREEFLNSRNKSI